MNIPWICPQHKRRIAIIFSPRCLFLRLLAIRVRFYDAPRTSKLFLNAWSEHDVTYSRRERKEAKSQLF